MGPRLSGSAVIMPVGERKMLHWALKIPSRCLVVSDGHTGLRPPKQLAVAPKAEEKVLWHQESGLRSQMHRFLALCGSLLRYL